MKNKKLLVITINYNSSQYTLKALNSFYNNHKNLDYFIYIVDNNSNIADYNNLKKGAVLFDNIEIIRSEKNLGFSKGNNLGLKNAYKKLNFDYILLMNNDIVINDKDLLNNMIEDMEKKGKNYVLEMPLVNNIGIGKNVNEQVQIRKLSSEKNIFINSSPILKKIFYKTRNDYIYKSKMPFIEDIDSLVLSGAFLLISNEFMKKIKYFDKDTFLYGEEEIIGFQANKFGYNGFLNTNYIVDHYQGGSSGKKKFSGFLFFCKYNSSMVYMKKYLKIDDKKIAKYSKYKKFEAFVLSLIIEKNLIEFKIFIENYKKLMRGIK